MVGLGNIITETPYVGLSASASTVDVDVAKSSDSGAVIGLGTTS